MNSAPTAAEITRRSQSNLALAFIVLPRERRADIAVFYAFCRVVDDLADEPGDPAEKQRGLDLWREALVQPVADEPSLAPTVRALIAKYSLPVAHFHEIIAGVEMDLRQVTFGTWEELRLYCHRVASVVGLVSIEIFGCKDPASRIYAEQLGLALQVTNIIRDVGADLRNEGRIYLPSEDLERFGVTPESLTAQRHDASFLALMEFEAERADHFYAAAQQALPPADRPHLVAAEIMSAVYQRLLQKMRRDRFRIFDRRYSVPRWQKTALIVQTLIRSRWARSS